jgi:hypothetical protein
MVIKLTCLPLLSYEDGKANAVAISMGGKSAVADAGASSELIFVRTLSSKYTPEDNWPLRRNSLWSE